MFLRAFIDSVSLMTQKDLKVSGSLRSRNGAVHSLSAARNSSDAATLA